MSTSSLPSSSGVASGGASRDSGSLLSSLTATHTRDSLGMGLARDSRDSRHPLGMMDSSVVGVRHGCGVSSSSENPLHILLIDNYDSYSYNLAQTLANANHATMPTVITNDAMTFDELDHFIKNNNVHAVVVSPGPGTPSNHKDVGVCRAIFERSSNLPLLGVCLGHQILGHVHGAAVAHTTPRDTPHHGRISRIKHDGTHDELFRGIGETDVVRYHSLCIHVNSQQAMDALVPTAWTEDGVIMAMRHRTRPHHGVQFHPESVLTTDGATMIRNFVDYVRGYWAHPNRATTTLDGNVIAAVEDVLLTSPDSAPPHGNGVWPLASMQFLGGLVGYLGYELGDDGTMETDMPGSTEEGGLPDSVLQFADRWVAVDHQPCDGTRAAAYVFALIPECASASTAPCSAMESSEHRGRDTGHSVRAQPSPANAAENDGGEDDDNEDDDDRRAHGIFFRSAFDDEEIKRARVRQMEWIEDVAHSITRIAAGWKKKLLSAVGDGDASVVIPDSEPPKSPPFIPRRSQAQYEEDVRTCQAFLREGESYELCLTTQMTRSPVHPSDWRPHSTLAKAMCGEETGPLATALTRRATSPHDIHRDDDDAEYMWLASCYHRLRRLNPAPYAAFLSAGVSPAGSRDAAPVMLCSSPELFLRLGRDGTLEARPIKGTAARIPNDTARDHAVAMELVNSEKDRAENLMICDLLRNDLGRVCDVATVHVPAFAKLESYATVHQLVSVVKGRRRGDVGPAECVRCAFPPGSMTGAPKRRSVALLRDVEGAPVRESPGKGIAGGRLRGVYSGSVGYFSLPIADDALGVPPMIDAARGASFCLNVVIRTAVAAAGKLHIGAGGAITVLSDPHEEWEEVRLKAERLLRAVASADAGANPDESTSVHLSTDVAW